MHSSYERGLVHADQPALVGLAGQLAVAAQWGGLALALALCYLGNIPTLKIAGVFLFVVLALQRIDLALTFVPLTTPFFLIQLRLPGFLPHAVPPHELALLLSCIAAAPQFAFSLRDSLRHTRRGLGVAHGLVALFVAASIFGIVNTAPEPVARQDALRAFRWFIVEPLLFVVLAFWLRAGQNAPGNGLKMPIARKLLLGLVAAGTLAAAWAVVQFAGTLVAPERFMPAMSMAYSADVIARLPRVTSVYTNPNNLGLFLGRVWPLAVALALIEWRVRRRGGWALAYAAAAATCVAGLVVSFSRGAWLGAGAALLVMVLPEVRRRFRARILASVLVGTAVLAGVGALALILRGSLAGASANVRLLFWREGLALIAGHPFGLGLDQFYYYHNPAFGRSLIDPALADTLERTAREPHTFLLELWLNLGPLGLLAFGGLIGLAFERLRQALAGDYPPESALLIRGAAAALAAALAHGLVDTLYFWPDLAITFWILIMLLWPGAPDQSAGWPPSSRSRRRAAI